MKILVWAASHAIDLDYSQCNLATTHKQHHQTQTLPLNELHWWCSRRWIVENVIRRIKAFNVTSHKWRHDRDLHKYVFPVVCEIVNIDMHYRPVRK